MGKKDFTPKQAKSWVAQEAAKHLDAESIRGRIDTERKTQAMMSEHGLADDFPLAAQARRDLIAVLEGRLA